MPKLETNEIGLQLCQTHHKPCNQNSHQGPGRGDRQLGPTVHLKSPLLSNIKWLKPIISFSWTLLVRCKSSHALLDVLSGKDRLAWEQFFQRGKAWAHHHCNLHVLSSKTVSLSQLWSMDGHAHDSINHFPLFYLHKSQLQTNNMQDH